MAVRTPSDDRSASDRPSLAYLLLATFHACIGIWFWQLAHERVGEAMRRYNDGQRAAFSDVMVWTAARSTAELALSVALLHLIAMLYRTSCPKRFAACALGAPLLMTGRYVFAVPLSLPELLPAVVTTYLFWLLQAAVVTAVIEFEHAAITSLQAR